MGIISNAITGIGGSGLNSDWFGTPYGNNTIPEATLTKAQKTFSSQAVTPNLPKPKSLYFVYFHLNPALDSRIQYKKLFIRMLLEKNGGLDTGGYKTDENVKAEMKSKILEEYKSAASSQFGEDTNKILGSIKGKLEPPELKDDDHLIDYIPPPELFKKLSFEMSKLVKSYDKPSVSSLDTTEFNEYNRKRLVYTGIKYNDVKISFYDVKESPVQQFFIAYLKFICNDFFCKDSNYWEKPIDNCHWQNALGYKNGNGANVNGTYYGNLNSFGLTIDSNFRLIDKISFCEYYMNKITVYTIENPVITSINWGSGNMGDFSSNDLTVTFKYEGITNDLAEIKDNEVIISGSEANTSIGAKIGKWIGDKLGTTSKNKLDLKYMVNHEIKKDVANFVQTKYSNLSGQLLSDITSTLKAYMNGDVKFSWNTLKNQALDTMRKYNMAGAANTIAQAEKTVKNFTKKDGAGRTQYLANMSSDPTSLIGKASSAVGSGGALF